MGSLIVNFQGICAWLPAQALLDQGVPVPPGVQWRVVLPHTSFGLSYLDTRTAQQPIPQAVPPHSASLNLAVPNNAGNTGLNSIASMTGQMSGVMTASATLWGLRGVSISVANAVSEGLNVSPPMSSLPSLSKQVESGEPMPPFAQDVVNGPNCSAYWDISVGKLAPSVYASPASPQIFYVSYTVETKGNPELTITTFFDQSQAQLTFASASPNIVIQNVGQDMDTWWDWIIHYLCFTDIPAGILPPGLPPTGVGDGATAGCSNSVWP